MDSQNFEEEQIDPNTIKDIKQQEDHLYDKKNLEYEQIRAQIFSSNKDIDLEEGPNKRDGTYQETSEKSLLKDFNKKCSLKANSSNYDPDFDRMNGLPDVMSFVKPQIQNAQQAMPNNSCNNIYFLEDQNMITQINPNIKKTNTQFNNQAPNMYRQNVPMNYQNPMNNFNYNQQSHPKPNNFNENSQEHTINAMYNNYPSNFVQENNSSQYNFYGGNQEINSNQNQMCSNLNNQKQYQKNYNNSNFNNINQSNFNNFRGKNQNNRNTNYPNKNINLNLQNDGQAINFLHPNFNENIQNFSNSQQNNSSNQTYDTDNYPLLDKS